MTVTVSRKAGQEVVELPGARARLRSAKGQEKEATFGLEPLVVGTSPDCDLVSDDPSVSRVHCQLTMTQRGVVIRDLGSKNGTRIGEVRVFEALLPPGTPLQLGSSTITVVVTGEPSVIPLSGSPRFGEAIGASVQMRALFATMERAAATNESILLLGESGTGKELIAQAIHDLSPRRERPFVVLDCGAVAATLIEAELFGYVKGAFTGANANHAGLIEQADGGTLFIDELGELPLELQPRLLRVLETRELRPVGANEYRRADVRVIAATHRDLKAQVAAKTFREDLYYRLAVVEGVVPPLRDRKDDIPMLVEHFLAGQDPPRNLADLPANAMDLLQGHSWPGNVRELRNTVARLVLFPHLGIEAIDLAAPQGQNGLQTISRLQLREARDLVVSEFEQSYIKEKLKETGGNVSAAAKSMGVSRQFVHRLMARYGIRGSHG
jgi:transcriptional regulator with PAS, ATPase and Fis domain